MSNTRSADLNYFHEKMETSKELREKLGVTLLPRGCSTSDCREIFVQACKIPGANLRAQLREKTTRVVPPFSSLHGSPPADKRSRTDHERKPRSNQRYSTRRASLCDFRHPMATAASSCHRHHMSRPQDALMQRELDQLATLRTD